VGLDDDPTKSAVLRLRSGDAVFMSKQSRYAWHGVPKILPDSCPEFLQEWPGDDPKYAAWRNWMSTKRVNLNVRQMYNNEA
jgi:alkylated DNA repair dioxygenase AlkB